MYVSPLRNPRDTPMFAAESPVNSLAHVSSSRTNEIKRNEIKQNEMT
jgi:hypothetical protein